MSRTVLFSTSAVASTLVMVLAASCGHSNDAMEAFKASKLGTSTGVSPGVTPTTNPTTTGTETVPDGPPKPQFACDAVNSQQFDANSMKGYSVPASVAAEVDATMRQMNGAQKASQMMGIPIGNKDYRDIERSPDVEIPGGVKIRGWRYRDAGRGVNLDAGQDNRLDDKKNYATAFPAPSLRAASWDVDLEKRIGAAIGDETAASLNNMLLAPCMNIIRHPYWGRTQETYGEDMYATGRMATALTVGIQEYVVACPKHFAANNIEKQRALQDAVMSEQTLREIYGRHFEMVIRDGAAGCIMASYNKVNGVKATQNEHLLRKVLKAPIAEGGMNFQGIVLTDWWAMPGDQNVPPSDVAQSDTIQAVKAGTDIEVPWQLHYTEATLAAADQSLVDDAARRVLTQKFLFKSAKTTDPWSLKPPVSTIAAGSGSITPNDAHEALAEEAVVKSAVLLANGLEAEPVLPLTAEGASVAVVGLIQNFTQISSSVPPTCGYDPGTGQGQVGARACDFNHATDPALGDRGSSRVNADPARSISVFRGLQETLGAAGTVVFGNTIAEAMTAETVVVVVGYTPGDEGEEYYIQAGGDRSSLNLPTGQNEFVQQVLDLQKPTVVVIQSGSIVNLPWLSHSNKQQATIWAGYPAQRGGLGLGKLIFGQANFAGKMPMAWPTEDLLQPFKESETLTNMGYFFGYRDYDMRKHVGNEEINLVFPFGHGLSYSTFEYSNAALPLACPSVSKEAIFEVTVDVKNTSTTRDGDEVVMLFVKPPAKPETVTGERPWKELKSFARVSVKAGETTTAKLPVRVQDLRRWEGDAAGRWVVDSGEYTLLVGKNADDAEAGANVVKVTVNGD